MAGTWTSDRRLYLAADGVTVVEHDDPRKATLLVPAGGTLPLDRARALGLVTPRAQAIGAMALGALLMTAADAGARFATFPYDLPLGLFATLLGTPWLLALMMRSPR